LSSDISTHPIRVLPVQSVGGLIYRKLCHVAIINPYIHTHTDRQTDTYPYPPLNTDKLSIFVHIIRLESIQGEIMEESPRVAVRKRIYSEAHN